MKALGWLLREPDWTQDSDGTPFECNHCPFGSPETRLHDAPNPADPGEGYYDCDLLGMKGERAVWGESPICKAADWRSRAREELGSCVNCGGLPSDHTSEAGFGLVCPGELAARTDDERFTYTPHLEPPPDVPANVRAALKALRPFEEQARRDLADAEHVEWAVTRSQDGNEGFIVSVERAIVDAINALTDDDSA